MFTNTLKKLNSSGEDCLPSQITPKSIQYYKNDVKENWKLYLDQYKKKWKI
jgi:hypothetical protein